VEVDVLDEQLAADVGREPAAGQVARAARPVKLRAGISRPTQALEVSAGVDVR